MKTATKVQKQVKIIARYELKDTKTGKPNGYAVYKVRSSDGTDEYKTTFLNGKATGCTCPATKPCYHMTQLQERENARQLSILANKAQERKARYEAAKASGESIVEYNTMEMHGREYSHFPICSINGGDWRICQENGKPVQGFFTERQALDYIEARKAEAMFRSLATSTAPKLSDAEANGFFMSIAKQQDLHTCDTCWRQVKPEFVTCSVCLGQ